MLLFEDGYFLPRGQTAWRARAIGEAGQEKCLERACNHDGAGAELDDGSGHAVAAVFDFLLDGMSVRRNERRGVSYFLNPRLIANGRGLLSLNGSDGGNIDAIHDGSELFHECGLLAYP